MALYETDEGQPVTTQSMIKTFRQCHREAYLLDRVAPHLSINAETGCWEWSASRTAYGYGQVRDPEKGRAVVVHKIVWEALNGEVPEGMRLDHVCQVRHCANPYHLRLATHSENEQYREARDNFKFPRNVKMNTHSGRTKPYYARIQAFGQTYQSGYFATIEEAEEAAVQLRKQHHKEFAS